MSLAACTPISSGAGFLKSSLVYLDCAGQAIGSTGFTTLTQPGSVISQLILVAISMFIAWQGIRMMFGRIPEMGDAVLAIAKIGLVLMLVTSWPAVRTLFADPAFTGPTELAAQTKLEGPIKLEDRLQRADDGIVALTKWGTGKLDIRAGSTADGKPAASEFSGVALTDSLALGLGRLCFLVGALMSIGLLKLLIGLMISALPIFAGMLLFETTRAMFVGWLRMVFALFLASFAIPLVLATELTLLEPWLVRAIAARSAFYATPSAPTELLAITGAFFLILMGSIAGIVKACLAVNVAVVAGRISSWRAAEQAPSLTHQGAAAAPASTNSSIGLSRAEGLAMTLGRHDKAPRNGSFSGGIGQGRSADNDMSQIDRARSGVTSTRRRPKQRMSLSHARRNQR